MSPGFQLNFLQNRFQFIKPFDKWYFETMPFKFNKFKINLWHCLNKLSAFFLTNLLSSSSSDLHNMLFQDFVKPVDDIYIGDVFWYVIDDRQYYKHNNKYIDR